MNGLKEVFRCIWSFWRTYKIKNKHFLYKPLHLEEVFYCKASRIQISVDPFICGFLVKAVA
jgi:hypothetical protein